VLGGISGLATGLLRLLIVLVLGPVIAFYVLVDLPRLRDWSLRHIPPGYRIEATQVGQELSAVMGGYLRGQLLVALFVGSAVTLGMWLIDLPFWLVVGIVAGLTNLVPLLGPFVAGAIGGTIALANGGVSFALLVIVVLTVVQQMDNHLISPLVMGQSVQLHPLMVLFALLIAGTLYGFIGLLIAVPTVATGRVLAHHAWITRVPWAQDEPLPSPEADLTVTETAEASSAPLRRTV
jgi:predicted PurR-regulated permease PerM